MVNIFLNNKLLSVSTIVFNDKYEIEYVCADGETYDIENVQVIWYTGYKDRQDVRIYDGDMVECEVFDKDNIRFVFWQNGWRVLGMTTEEFADNLDLIKVVGNRWVDSEKYEEYAKKYKI